MKMKMKMMRTMIVMRRGVRWRRETSRATTMSSKPMLPPASSESRHMNPRGPTSITMMRMMIFSFDVINIILKILYRDNDDIDQLGVLHPVVDGNHHHRLPGRQSLPAHHDLLFVIEIMIMMVTITMMITVTMTA